MGIASSPLSDHVVFIEGAPRSGTTWLLTLLATHPDIAGAPESHLFNFGVDRLFDNFEVRNPPLPRLQSWVERDEFVDLVRDLCDGLFMGMRSHVAGDSDPAFVVEKTPVDPRTGALDLARKREVYPDGWYLHVVRDREAVARSLMRAPWIADRSYEACSRMWEEAVGLIRERFGDLDRYHELVYEDLRADPGEALRPVLEALGVASDEHTLETMRVISQQQLSEMGAVPPPARRGWPPLEPRALASKARRGLGRARRKLSPGATAEQPSIAFEFVRALRERDPSQIDALTRPDLELELRGPDRDLTLRAADARAAVLELAEEAFDRRYYSEWWITASGPSEWWASAAGKPFVSIFFSALGGDATRVDLALCLAVEDGLVRRLIAITAGPLSGRPVLASDATS